MAGLESKLDNLSAKMDVLERLFRDKLGLFDQVQFTNDVTERLNRTLKTILDLNMKVEIDNLKKQVAEITQDMEYTANYVNNFATNFAELVAVKIMKKIEEKAKK